MRLGGVNATIDLSAARRKHRARVGRTVWAPGTKTSSLAPSLLVAMPQLQDPNFSKSVVLLCEHREEGAMGLVINRCTDTLASAIVQLDPPLESDDSGLPVWIGGPVDPARGWLLLAENLGDGIEVSPGLYLSASRDLLRRVLESRDARRAAAASWSATPAGARASSTPSWPPRPGSRCRSTRR